MKVSVSGFEIPRLASVEIWFGECNELVLGPSLRGIRADVDRVISHASEKCRCVGFCSGLMPCIYELVNAIGGPDNYRESKRRVKT
jgi:hypothetical protein